MAENDWVELRHPALPDESTDPTGGNFRCPRVAYDETWKDLGWEIVADAAPPAAPAPAAPPAPPVTSASTTSERKS